MEAEQWLLIGVLCLVAAFAVIDGLRKQILDQCRLDVQDAELEHLKRQVCELQQHIQKTRIPNPNNECMFDCDRAVSGDSVPSWVGPNGKVYTKEAR